MIDLEISIVNYEECGSQRSEDDFSFRFGCVVMIDSKSIGVW